MRGKTGSEATSGGLVAILLDRRAPEGDRDDAAGDLSKYDDPQVEAALIGVSSDPATDPDMADTCGDSLGEIWVRTGFVKPAVFLQLQPAAQRLAIAWLWAERPDLVEKIERDTVINPVHEYWALREAGSARPPDQLDALPAYLRREVPGFADCPELAGRAQDHPEVPDAVLGAFGRYVARMQAEDARPRLKSLVPHDVVEHAATFLEYVFREGQPEVHRVVSREILDPLRSNEPVFSALMKRLGPHTRLACETRSEES